MSSPPWTTVAWGSGRCASRSTPLPREVGWCSTCPGRWPSSSGGPGARPVRRPALQARCRPAPDRPHALRRAPAHRRPDRPGPRRQPHLHLQSLGTGHGRGERGRGAANGVHGVSAGERLVTVLVTVAVPEAADPEDAAALVADAAVSSALDVVHAVGVEGHLPVAGSTVVPIGTSQPAAVLAVGEGSALLRHLDGEVRQVPLPGLAPDPLDPANTHPGFVSQDAF